MNYRYLEGNWCPQVRKIFIREGFAKIDILKSLNLSAGYIDKRENFVINGLDSFGTMIFLVKVLHLIIMEKVDALILLEM